jgi:hypothetical protein
MAGTKRGGRSAEAVDEPALHSASRFFHQPSRCYLRRRDLASAAIDMPLIRHGENTRSASFAVHGAGNPSVVPTPASPRLEAARSINQLFDQDAVWPTDTLL